MHRDSVAVVPPSQALPCQDFGTEIVAWLQRPRLKQSSSTPIISRRNEEAVALLVASFHPVAQQRFTMSGSAPACANAEAIRWAVNKRPPDWFTILSEAQRPRPSSPSAIADFTYELGRALHQAARHDLPLHAGLLLARGARPDARDTDGEFEWGHSGDDGPPLLTCAEWRRGSERVARVLMAWGASIRGVDAAAVMERAVRHGHVGLLRLMVEFGMDVDERSGVGWTALHVAAKLGLVVVAQVLIVQLGADVMALTAREESVEDVARRHEKAQFIEWLYLSEHVRPAEGTNPIVKRCHASAFNLVYGL